MGDVRDDTHVLRFRGEVKDGVPSVDAARPAACVVCVAAAYCGSRVVLHGHGVRERQQRGPATADGRPECGACWARRYRCTECDAVMTVLPASAQPYKHFSGRAIALALALWGDGTSAAAVRERVSDWKPGLLARGWRSLRRWARDAAVGPLFAALKLGPVAGGPQRIAQRVGQALCGWAPAEARALPVPSQAFFGSAHVA